jgi:hypothetical protein
LFRNPLMPNAARLAAAEALLKLESAPAVVTLLGALRRDNWQVRRNAAAVLGQLQAGWATDALIAALNDPHQAVQRTAAAALRRINSPDAIHAANAYDELQKRAGTQPLTPPESTPAESTEPPQPVPATPAAPPEASPPTEMPADSPTPTPSSTPDQAAIKSAVSRMAKWVETREMAAVSDADAEKTPDPDGQSAPADAKIEPAEPVSSTDDTKPSRPTAMRSPFQQADNKPTEEKPDSQ